MADIAIRGLFDDVGRHDADNVGILCESFEARRGEKTGSTTSKQNGQKEKGSLLYRGVR
jgi:hypothetical protein